MVVGGGTEDVAATATCHTASRHRVLEVIQPRTDSMPEGPAATAEPRLELGFDEEGRISHLRVKTVFSCAVTYVSSDVFTRKQANARIFSSIVRPHGCKRLPSSPLEDEAPLLDHPRRTKCSSPLDLRAPQAHM